MKKSLIIFSLLVLPFVSIGQFTKGQLNFNLLPVTELITKTWVVSDYKLPGTSANMQSIMDALVDEMKTNTYLRFTREKTYEFYTDGEIDKGTYRISDNKKEVLLTNNIRSRKFKIKNINKKQMDLEYKDPTGQIIKMSFTPAPEQ